MVVRDPTLDLSPFKGPLSLTDTSLLQTESPIKLISFNPCNNNSIGLKIGPYELALFDLPDTTLLTLIRTLTPQARYVAA